MAQFPMNNRMPANFSNPNFQNRNFGMQQPMQYPMQGQQPMQGQYPMQGQQSMQYPMQGQQPMQGQPNAGMQQAMQYPGMQMPTGQPYMLDMGTGRPERSGEMPMYMGANPNSGAQYPNMMQNGASQISGNFGYQAQQNNLPDFRQQNKMMERDERDARRLGGIQDNWAMRNERNIAQGRSNLAPVPPARMIR